MRELFSRPKIIVTTVTVLITIVVAGLLYMRFYVPADTLSESIDPALKLSQIPTSTDLEPSKDLGDLEISIAKGELESFAVLLENTGEMTYSDLTIGKNDLISADGKPLLKELIDERVVHNWPQKIMDWSGESDVSSLPDPVAVDELLVKNEMPDVAPPGEAYNGDPFFSETIGAEPNQLLRSTGASSEMIDDGLVKTSVSAGQKKKFYFTVNTSEVLPGSYSGWVDYISDDRAVAKFKLVVNVLDIALESPTSNGIQNGCYMNDRIANDISPEQNAYISAELFRKRLKTIKDAGCDSPVFRVGTNSDYLQALRMFSELKFAGPIIINFGYTNSENNFIQDNTLETFQAKEQFKQVVRNIIDDPEIHLPILFYAIDEPNTAERYDLFKIKASEIKFSIAALYGSNIPSKIINQVTTSASSETFANLFNEPSGEFATDYPIYSIKSAIDGVVRKEKDRFYYQGYLELRQKDGLVNINRFYSGIVIAREGLHGAMVNPVYGFSGITQPLFDDFKIDPANYNGTTWHKHMLVFTPASDGFIPTLQSESWREGILDLKYYLTYLKAKSVPLPDPSSDVALSLARIENELAAQLAKYNFGDVRYALPEGMTNEDLDVTRGLLKEYLITYNTDLLPPQIVQTNLTEGQIITSNPFIIEAKVSDNKAVKKVNFYVDGQLIATSTMPDVESVYQAVWDTSKYHSTVRIEAVDNVGNTTSSEYNTTVSVQESESGPVKILPKTGGN